MLSVKALKTTAGSEGMNDKEKETRQADEDVSHQRTKRIC